MLVVSRHALGVYMIFRSESGDYFLTSCRLKVLLLYGPVLIKKKKKKNGKDPKFYISQFV